MDHPPNPEDPADTPEPPDAPPSGARSPAGGRLLLAAVLLALFAAMLGYKILEAGGLEQTALFYVGLPALIALTVAATAAPRSPVGVAMAVTTIGLALAGPLLNEGVVCLLMAAPLFYGTAAVLGAGLARARRGTRHPGRNHALVLVPVLLLCVEGVAGVSYLPRGGEGTAQRVVGAGPERVAAALAEPPDYASPRSAFLRVVPFPRPDEARGSGLEVGDRRTVEFAGHERTTMTLEVTESDVRADSGRVVFTVVGDTTLARWLELRSAEASWEPAPGGTKLDWTLRYRRTFDPSWYWGPLQGYGMDRAAGYLLDTVAAEAYGQPPAGRTAP
ncbi:hypothetical protein FHX37_2996 [Haloactinospora alba]|uniref:Uncharacterized protein n=1 Tax=Haloactinospora alba TaxID=405555 RepID=A0A543NME6_9ACTN|nr:SRPBCC family protein [Haloactinospora alba]TQN33002.1 hypothetical protein FHX37_2996 [Haloactinospora alba]